MLRRWFLASFLSVTLLTLASGGAERLPPAAEWIPQDAIFAVQIENPKPLLDLATGEKVAAAVTASPAWKAQADKPEFRIFLGVVNYLEAQLETDWKTGLRKLLGGGVTAGATPTRGSVLVVDSLDAKLLTQFHDIVRTFAKGEAEKQGKADRVKSFEHDGVTVWTFGDKEFHAIVGSRFILSDREEMLKEVLDLRKAKGKGSLAATAPFQQAKKAVGTPIAHAFLNFGLVKMLPGVQQGLTANKNPGGALLLGGAIDALRTSTWLDLKLDVQDDTLTLALAADGKADPKSVLASFASPSEPGKGALPGVAVPRQIASMTFYRDLHAFYAAKDKLFPDRTSGLIFFENMMAIFFSGRDLTQEVLAEMDPEIRFVVAGQKYSPAATPQVQIPAFAAIFRLKDPKKFEEIAVEAWQKAVGLVSFTRGQKGQPGLVIDRDFYNDTKYSVAYFPTSGIEDKKQVPVQYNFRPALVVVGDSLVFSSTDGLAKDLIDALKKEAADKPAALANTNAKIELDAAGVVPVLQANREQLVRQNMVEKGNSLEQAKGEIDALFAILKYVGKVAFTMGEGPEGTRAALTVKLNLAE